MTDTACHTKSAAIKQRAEDLAMELLQSGLVTDDTQLAEACVKLRPHRAKLAMINRDIVRKGLALIEVEDPFGNEEEQAKACLLALLAKLEGMKSMFGAT